jgi:hypothetical protein
VPRILNIKEEFKKDWNGKRDRHNCGFGHVHVQTWHTMMDDNEWIWRQVRDRLFDDLSRLFLNEIYQDVLNRPIDESGYMTYSSALANGFMTLAEIRHAVAYSPEARNLLEVIYREIWGRTIEQENYEFYASALAVSWSLANVRADIEARFFQDVIIPTSSIINTIILLQ